MLTKNIDMTKSFEEIYKRINNVDSAVRIISGYAKITKSAEFNNWLADIILDVKELCEENQRLKAEIEKLKGDGDA